MPKKNNKLITSYSLWFPSKSAKLSLCNLENKIMLGTGIIGSSSFIILGGRYSEFIHDALLLLTLFLGALVVTSFILTRLIRFFIK